MGKRKLHFAAALMALLLAFSAAVAEGQLPYRIAARDEGVALLLGNTAYCERFTQNDLDYRTQKRGATPEDWRTFAAAQVLEFTEDERDALRDGMAAIAQILDAGGYALPELGELIFVKTTQREECGSDAYTLGNQIYLGADALASLRFGDEISRGGLALLCHEIFHCLTRNNPEFRRNMYSLIHFTVHEKEYELSPQLREIYFSNPDVGRHDASANFVINGEETECYVVCVVDAPFEQPGDNAFDHVGIALVPVEHPDTYFERGDAENFWQVFGRNTGYVLDPEECMADNFGYALTYGATGPDGKPFSNPEILDAIREYFKK